MIKLLLDPRLINFVLMFLFLANATRWAFTGRWLDVLYWIASFLITVAVTFK